MNDREIIAELAVARKSRCEAIPSDQKINVMVEIYGRAFIIDAIVIVPPVQAKQLYEQEGHLIVLQLNEESGR